MFSCLRKRRARIARAESATRESERVMDHVDSQWAEVNERVEFARNQREMNHLTQLFIESRGHRA